MTLWGGRFDGPMSPDTWDFTVSPADRRLLEADVAGSRAHLVALRAAQVVTAEQADELEDGLSRIADEAATGAFSWESGDEDVHSAVERRLTELVGEDLAGRIHSGRSRNDQVALDLQLYISAAASGHMTGLGSMVRTLATAAAEAGESIVAGFTHLQQAQPVPFAHHLLAHAWPLVRDFARFEEVGGRSSVSPLGAAAGGGTSLPIDPEVSAGALGLDATFDNSLDAVAARDVVVEYVFCCAQALTNLSRLGEEIVLWSSTEFGWMTLPDSHSTGSSALPQKRNPDIAELTRGKAASAAGHLAALLGIQKGLPMSYNRDMQQDKEHLFSPGDDLDGALAALSGLIAGAEFHPPPPGPNVAALDLAEALVARGTPFRRAHDLVGSLVRALEDDGRTLAEVKAADLAAAGSEFEAADAALADPAASVAARRSAGGGSFESVRRQLAKLKAWEGFPAGD